MNHQNISRSYGYGLSILSLFLLVLVGIIGITSPLVSGDEAEVVVVTDEPAAKPIETMDVSVDDAVGVLHIDLTKFRFDLLKTLTAKTKTMKLEKGQIDTILKCATLINSVDVLFLLNQRGFPEEPIAIVRGKVSPQDIIDLGAVLNPEAPKLKPFGNGRYKSEGVTFIYGKQAADVPDGMLIISSPKMQGEKMLSSITNMTTLPQPATTNKPDTTKPIWGAINFTVPGRNGPDETFDFAGSGDPSGKGSGIIIVTFADEELANEMVEGFFIYQYHLGRLV